MFSRQIKVTNREDGVTLSTVQPFAMNWFGKFETAIAIDSGNWAIAEGYDTEEDAGNGHAKYENMTKEELENLEYIG